MKFAITKIAAGFGAAVVVNGAQAAAIYYPSGVFNVYSVLGLDQAATPIQSNIPFITDPTISGYVDQAAGTWGVSSTIGFYGVNWTASGGRLITLAGDYALDTTTDAIYAAAPDTIGTPDGIIHFTVGAGQLAGAIDFAWLNSGITRFVNVWTVGADGSLIATGVPGLENSPFATGLRFAFNLSPVPEASTCGMMLVGLGLVGGMAGRRRR